MENSFENKLREKAYKIKIKPSNKLEQSILEDIKQFSQKTTRIRRIKQASIIATSLVTAIIIALTLTKPNTQQTPITQIITHKTTAKQHPQNQKNTLQQTNTQTTQQTNNTNTHSITKNNSTNTQNIDTILCSSEYTIDNNQSNTNWKTPQDNIIISNATTQTTFLFAKPGYYKVFSYDTKGSITDSIIFISLFIPQKHIITCDNQYILTDIIGKYTYIDTHTQGIEKRNNSIVVQKTTKNKLNVPITFRYKSQTIKDTLYITFAKKPFVEPQITKISENLYSVSFSQASDLQYFINDNQIKYSTTLSSGTYTVKIINQKTKCDTLFIITIKETQTLSPDFDYTVLQKRAGIPFYFQNKTKASTKTGLNYKWDFGDNTYSSKESPTHIYEKSGNYNVKLTVTDNKGNSKSIQKTIIVLPPDKTSQPNVFTPNNDGKNDVFRVQLPYKVENFKCEIFTRDGNKVYELNNINNSWDGKINNNPAAEGIYYYIITGKTTDGKDFVEKNFLYLYR